MSPIRPPMMQAPDRGRADMSAPFPVSIKREAERLVIQAAKELRKSQTGTAIGVHDAQDRLDAAVDILNKLEG